jgi:hypothetical protein
MSFPGVLRLDSLYFAPECRPRRRLCHVQSTGYFIPLEPSAAETKHSPSFLGKVAAEPCEVQTKFEQGCPTGSDDSLWKLSASTDTLQPIKLRRVPAKGSTKGAHKNPLRILRVRVGTSPVEILGNLCHRLFHQLRRDPRIMKERLGVSAGARPYLMRRSTNVGANLST